MCASARGSRDLTKSRSSRRPVTDIGRELDVWPQTHVARFTRRLHPGPQWSLVGQATPTPALQTQGPEPYVHVAISWVVTDYGASPGLAQNLTHGPFD